MICGGHHDLSPPSAGQRASGVAGGDEDELQLVEIILTLSTLSFGASELDALELELPFNVPVTST
jgi:hypothetical protein